MRSDVKSAPRHLAATHHSATITNHIVQIDHVTIVQIDKHTIQNQYKSSSNYVHSKATELGTI